MFFRLSRNVFTNSCSRVEMFSQTLPVGAGPEVSFQKWKLKLFFKEELGLQGAREGAQRPFWAPGETTLASETRSEIARGRSWSPRGSRSGLSSPSGVILG